MRILLLAPCRVDDVTFRVVLGGLGKVYAAAGHEVVVAGQFTSGGPSRAEEDGPHFRIRRLGRPGAGAIYLYGLAETFFQTLRLLKDADFVHCHIPGIGYPAGETLVTWAACRLRGVRMGLTIQDIPAPTRPRWWRDLWSRNFLGHCAYVAAVSRKVADAVAAIFPDMRGRLAVVPSGFSPEELSAIAACPRPRPFVLCIGRLAVYKGIDILLMAWKDVCEQFSDVDLLICGLDRMDGHYQGLAALLGISDRVIFTGELDRASTIGLMKSCLFQVLPSRSESFGIAVLEGMVCGKAVLATRSGGPEELLQDGVSGVLVPPLSADALRDAMRDLLRDPRRRQDIGARARVQAGPYTWDSIGRRYLEMMGVPGRDRV
jgi:glycosyltransferase involved in cell wall biosynthesis